MTRRERLARVPDEPCYRLMVINLNGRIVTGQTSGVFSLSRDVAEYTQPGCRPLYSVFVRPH